MCMASQEKIIAVLLSTLHQPIGRLMCQKNINRRLPPLPFERSDYIFRWSGAVHVGDACD